MHICIHRCFIQEQKVAVFFHPLVNILDIQVYLLVYRLFCIFEKALKKQVILNTDIFNFNKDIPFVDYFNFQLHNYFVTMYIQILYNTLNNNNKPSSSNQRASNLTTFISKT